MRRARATGLDVDYNTTFAAFSNQIRLACELRCFPSEDKTVLFLGEDRVALFFPIPPDFRYFRGMVHLPHNRIKCAWLLFPAPAFVLRPKPSGPLARVLPDKQFR